ncbi:hypothetical protein KIPB_010444, partial [Kipferlia bialata]
DDAIRAFFDKHVGPVHDLTVFRDNPRSWSVKFQKNERMFELQNLLQTQQKPYAREETTLRRVLNFLYVLPIIQTMTGWFRDPYWYVESIDKLSAKERELDKGVELNAYAVVVFKSAQDKVNCIEFFKTSLYKRLFCCMCKSCLYPPPLRDNFLKVKAAPAPNDIVWGNLHLSKANRVVRTVLIYIGCMVFFALFMAFFCVMRVQQGRWQGDMRSWVTEQLVYWSSYLIIAVSDGLLHPFIRKLAMFEGHHTLTQWERAILRKYYVYQLLNKLTPIIAQNLELVLDQGADWYVLLQLVTPWDAWRSTGGYDVLCLMLIEVFLYNFLDVSMQWGFLWYRRLGATTEYGKIRAECGTPMFMSVLYTNTLVVLTFSLGYAIAEPAILVLTIAYFVIHFYCTKLRLLRMVTRPPAMDHGLSQTAEAILVWIPIFCACLAYQYFGLGEVTRSGVNLVVISYVLLGVTVLCYVPFMLLFRFSTQDTAFEALRRDRAPVVSAVPDLDKYFVYSPHTMSNREFDDLRKQLFLSRR